MRSAETGSATGAETGEAGTKRSSPLLVYVFPDALMTLVLRALERDVKATLAEFVLCHDRDEAEALMVAFEGAGVDFVDLISDPHFYLQIGTRPDAKGMVRVGRGRVQQKTASAVIDAIIASAQHSRDNNVTLALVDLETIN